jgi:glycosyltransferase involved in cell wall biosynthesis
VAVATSGKDRVALVHDFLVQDGGAERCALELARLLPDAPVHTSFFDSDAFSDRIDPSRVRPWPLQRLLHGRHFRALLPAYPLYFSALDLRDAELVVSSSVAFAKAVRTSRRALHISYIHTPLRYAWDLEAYLAGSSYRLPTRLASRLLRQPMLAWDRRTARGPDILIANSENVRRRIEDRWGRSAEVIHPPVDTSEFRLSGRDDGFLLVAARLLAYRRVGDAIEAAGLLNRELVVVGDGPERDKLRRLAGPTVRFAGHLPRPALIDLFERCHAYLLPGVEDFGIAPVEAMAAGKPVVALARGGALETVVDGETGFLYEDAGARPLAEAVERLDGAAFDVLALRAHAERFDRCRFRAAWRALLERTGVDRRLYDAATTH